MHVLSCAIAVLSILFFLVPAQAKRIYMWTDQNGVTHVGEAPPKQGDTQSFNAGESAAPSKAGPTAPGKPAPGPAQTDAAKPGGGGVEVYVTSRCPWCTKAIDFLKSKGVPHTVYNIENDAEAAARKRKLDTKGRGVPFAMIYGTPVHGFSAQAYERALEGKK